MMKKYKLRFQSYLAPFTKELRTRRRSTQERMAEQLRITTRSYSDLEREKSCFSGTSLIFLIILLTREELFGMQERLRELAALEDEEDELD